MLAVVDDDGRGDHGLRHGQGDDDRDLRAPELREARVDEPEADTRDEEGDQRPGAEGGHRGREHDREKHEAAPVPRPDAVVGPDEALELDLVAAQPRPARGDLGDGGTHDPVVGQAARTSTSGRHDPGRMSAVAGLQVMVTGGASARTAGCSPRPLRAADLDVLGEVVGADDEGGGEELDADRLPGRVDLEPGAHPRRDGERAARGAGSQPRSWKVSAVPPIMTTSTTPTSTPVSTSICL